jgi:hypothetical protein
MQLAHLLSVLLLAAGMAIAYRRKISILMLCWLQEIEERLQERNMTFEPEIEGVSNTAIDGRHPLKLLNRAGSTGRELNASEQRSADGHSRMGRPAVCCCSNRGCWNHKDKACSNESVMPIRLVRDRASEADHGSEIGMCQECWDNYTEELGQVA